jgi:hypothetical protein
MRRVIAMTVALVCASGIAVPRARPGASDKISVL